MYTHNIHIYMHTNVLFIEAVYVSDLCRHHPRFIAMSNRALK